jgi:hypothetical protein
MLIRHWPLIGNNTRDVSGNNVHSSHPGRLVYTFYNHTFASHANTEAELDAFFTPGANTTFGGTGIHATNINFSTVTGGKPGYLPADYYSWMVEGDVIIPTSGTYAFGVDADDATDISINGVVVASWYGGHGFADDLGASHSGTVFLPAGSHRFRARFEEIGGGDGIKAYWRKPGDGGFSLIPAENFSGILPAPGKIGLSAAFNGADTHLRTPTFQRVNGDEISVAAWFRQTNRTGYQQLVANRSTGGDYNWLLYFHTDDGSIQFHGAAQYKSTNIPALNQWNHVVATVNSSRVCRVYLNGNLVQTVNNFEFGPAGSQFIHIGASFPGAEHFSGSMNDVRVYSRAISEYEIRELSKAKVAHYAFDDPEEEPTVNHVPDASSMTGWTGYEFGNDGTFTTEFGTTGYNMVNRPSWNGLYRSVTVPSTGVYTFSAWFRYFGGNAENNGATVYVSGWGGSDQAVALDKSKLGQWQRVSMTLNVTNTTFTFYLISFGGTYGGGYSTWQVTMPQVEPKGASTPFVDGSRNIRVSDRSGFNNNLTTVVSSCPRWSSDSRSGSGSFLFSNNIVTGPSAFAVGADTLTLSAWVKPAGTHSDDRGIVVQQNGNYYLTVTTAQEVSVYWYGTSNEGYHTTTQTLPLDQWSHIATVWNGTQNLIYINGTLVKTTATNTPGLSLGPDPLTIGGHASGRRFNGRIDDVRQYSTALSATDIRSLYEVRAQVERSGAFYAKELLSNVEDTVNLIGATSDQLGSWSSFGFGSRGTLTIDSTQSPKISGQVIRITNNSGSNGITEIARYVPLRPFMPGQIVTSSAYVKGVGTSIGKAAYAHIYNTGPSGTKSVSGSGVVLTDQWQRVQNIYTWDFGAPSSEASHIYFYVDMNIGESFLMSNVQFEYKSYPTPFTSSYRGATQLPSGVQFGGNEIHETGIANFEDFSEVGITEALVGYWPLNGDTKDYSGFNRNGTALGGAFSSGDSYYFDGVNDTISFGTGNTFFPLLSHTISVMFRSDGITSTTGENPSLFGFTYGMRALLGSNGVPTFVLSKTNGSASVSSSTGYNYHDGLWHMFTGTCDGSMIKLYLDGVYQGQASVSSFWDGYTSWPTNTWNLGRDNNDGFLHFKGNMKHHKIFNRALTAEEVGIEHSVMLNGIAQIHKSGTVHARELVEY